MRTANATAWTYAQPAVGSIGSLLVGGFLAFALPLAVRAALGRRDPAATRKAAGAKGGNGNGSKGGIWTDKEDEALWEAVRRYPKTGNGSGDQTARWAKIAAYIPQHGAGRAGYERGKRECKARYKLLGGHLAPPLDSSHDESERSGGGNLETALLVLLAVLTAGLGWACAVVGSSDLLGCFLAGLALGPFKEARDGFERYAGALTRAGGALFFACTIAFTVPSFLQGSGGLLEPGALAMGGALTGVAVRFGEMDGEKRGRGHREVEGQRQRDRETERQRGREAERERGREAERQRDRETERDTLIDKVKSVLY